MRRCWLLFFKFPGAFAHGEQCYLANFSHRTLCFRCNAPRTRECHFNAIRVFFTKAFTGATANGIVVAQMSPFSGFSATGDSDVSPDGIASQFLLLRGLEPGVNEELLAKGVSKLYRTKASTPPNDTQGSRRAKISSTTNDTSLGAKDGSLRRILLVRDRKTNDSWRYGFAEFNTVEDAQAAMVKYNVSDKFTISSKPVMVSYIHAGVFVPVLNPSMEDSSKFTFSPLSSTSVKLMYWDEAAYTSELVIAAPDQTSPLKTQGSAHARLAAAAATEGLVSSGKDGEPRLKKRKLEKESKPVAPHLQFWTNRHAELHGQDPTLGDSEVPNILPTVPQDRESFSLDNPVRSFADFGRNCCLLCSRQFKTGAEVNKHERMSQLHKDNLQRADLVDKALKKLGKPTNSTSETSAYRDRAKERRQAFNQPKQPAAQHSKAAIDPSETQFQKEMSPNAIPSKGAALLGKMGWSAGEGLGAQGKGRTEAIKTEIYSQGVGLGAQGGKVGDAVEEAHRQTKGSYADFVSNVKDRAKERFESLH